MNGLDNIDNVLGGDKMNPQQPQPLASTSQLISTPSTDDGVPKSLENDLRVAGCMMIQEAGIMLNLYVPHNSKEGLG
jgi:hypothetical protein